VATITSWCRRGLDSASANAVRLASNIGYSTGVKRTPLNLNVVVTRMEEDDLDLPPRRLQLSLNASEVRHLGDAVVDFLSKLEG
jgi:hypothetical protein